MAGTPRSRTAEDVPIPTCCGRCDCRIGTEVRRENGVVTEVAGFEFRRIARPKHLEAGIGLLPPR